MIERKIINWLISRGFDAYSNVPNPRPARFVSVDLTGGGASDLVTNALITIDVWALSRGDAATDADAIYRAFLHDSRRGRIPGAGRVDVNASPYWQPDPDSRTPRYRMVLEVAHTS